ncbi:GlxA family transcriptional regulator, partial [Klebsiella pneumoniae]|nr:GlxA family transcriptional regulator [Klebsiella pneumoniae]
MHTVGFYIYPGHQILDLAGPFGAVESVTRILGHSFYELSTVSRAGGRVCGSGGLPVESSLATSAETDTLIVVGGDTVTMLDSGEAEVV